MIVQETSYLEGLRDRRVPGQQRIITVVRRRNLADPEGHSSIPSRPPNLRNERVKDAGVSSPGIRAAGVHESARDASDKAERSALLTTMGSFGLRLCLSPSSLSKWTYQPIVMMPGAVITGVDSVRVEPSLCV